MKPGCWNGEHHLILPDHVADWDATSHWERARFASMQETLKPDMTLFDVGTEHGSISAVYAKWVKDMVLFEPSPDFWVNIRKTWEANNLPMPAGWYVGLVTAEETEQPTPDYDDSNVNGWPACSWGDVECPAMAYRYKHEEKHAASTRHTTIDNWVAVNGIDPDAITIDVEGAELLVLQGAQATLERCKPIVWVSIHPDLMERDYPDSSPELLQQLMRGLGYHSRFLETDHEEHWMFAAN